MNKEIIELILNDKELSTEQKTEIIIEMVKQQNISYIPWYDPNPQPNYWSGPVTIASQSPIPDTHSMPPSTVMTTASYDPDWKGDVSSLVEYYKNVAEQMKKNKV